jgi:inorganic pyrophosphatase/exopolyphosphatase
MSGTAILNKDVEDILSKEDAKQFNMQQVLAW